MIAVQSNVYALLKHILSICISLEPLAVQPLHTGDVHAKTEAFSSMTPVGLSRYMCLLVAVTQQGNLSGLDVSWSTGIAVFVYGLVTADAPLRR